MHIVKLVAENFKKLKVVEIVPQGNIIEITGKCEAGKTSILDAVKAALCGEKFEDPIRQGQEKGKVVVDLGDKIVTRSFAKSGGSLTVESKDGAKYSSPQTLLDSMVGKIAFNPLEFAKADSKKQVEMLLKVVKLEIDPAKIKEISGVSVAPTPNPLDMLNSAYNTVFETRTIANRILDTAKKALASMPEVEKTEPVSLAELVAEKEGLEKINSNNYFLRDRKAKARKALEDIKAQEKVMEDTIAQIEANLKTARHKLSALMEAATAAEEDYEEEQRLCEGLKDESLEEIKEKIAKADETNSKAQRFKDRQAKATEVSAHQAGVDDLNSTLEAIRNYKTEIISNTKFPVPGLDFAGGGVIFEGKPFSQASGAQKMRVGVGIGMAANPQLRVIMLDGYESLDSDQRKIVEEMAAENGFQVWTTAVECSGKVGLFIEDGSIKPYVGGE